MVPWAKIAGATLKTGASIFGGISGARAYKKVKKNIQAQRQKNQDWYDRRYNEDATQRADAQRLLTLTEENIKNRNRQAAGTQAVMGGTEESTAATKAANNQVLVDSTAQIAAAADARKDNIEQQYRENDDKYQQQINNAILGKQQQIQGAVQGVSEAADGLMK